jgi:hypothetical protein
MRSHFSGIWVILLAACGSGGGGGGVCPDGGDCSAAGSGGGSGVSGEGGTAGTAGGGPGESGGASGAQSGGSGGVAGDSATGGAAGEGMAGAPPSGGASGSGGGSACGGADLATDPKNCGVCGHDCLGGGCSAGKCQPVQIAPISGAFVVDGSHLYTYDSSAILKLDKTASAAPTTIATTWVTPFYFAQDFPNIYFSAFASPALVYRLAKSGGTPVKIAAETQQGYGVAVDSQYAYYLRQSGEVMRVSKSGTNGSPEVFVAPPAGKRAGLLLTARDSSGTEYLYWLWVDQATFNSPSIARMHAWGLETAKVIATGTDIDAFRVENDRLYWFDQGVGIFDQPASGGAATPLVTAATAGADAMTGYGLVVGGGYVYWTSRKTQTLYRVPVGGGSPESMLTGVNFNTTTQERIASDGERLYFAVDDGIYMLAH